MARKKRRIVAADGLTYTEVVTVSSETVTPAELRALQPDLVDALTFIESFWRPHLPSSRARPKHQSFSWYAKEIMRWVAWVRRSRRQSSDDFEAAVHSAVHIGWLHGTAFWRFNLGDQARRGVKTLAHVRKIARNKRALGVCNPNIVANEARRLRAKHPYARGLYSTRWLAKEIANSQSYAFSTVRRRLKQLSIR